MLHKINHSQYSALLSVHYALDGTCGAFELPTQRSTYLVKAFALSPCIHLIGVQKLHQL